MPVDNINNFVRTAGYSSGSPQSYDLLAYTEPFANGYSTETTTEISEYNDMKGSVEINHGFYIGRYETGKDSSENAVVKKGANVYNNVPWGFSMNYIEGTTAVNLSKTFATINHYEGVTSTLCYGVQWDATLKFIDPDYTGFAKDSSKQGWYSDNYNKTDSGNTETNPNQITGKDLIYDDNPNVIANKQKNIYDMAGNELEWTMEACLSNDRVFRGGSYGSDGTGNPASYRAHLNPNTRIGFRIALHL